MEIQLSKLIGRKVAVLGPQLFGQQKLESVTLLGVDQAGIWIESEDAVNAIVEKFRIRPAAGGLAFFVPFTQITTIIAGFD